MTEPIPPLIPPAAEQVPSTLVDAATAYDLAAAEQQGNNLLAEKGLTALGDTYLSYTNGDGQVVVATAREAMTVCPHLAQLPGAVLGSVIESMRVEPTAQDLKQNLALPSA